MKIKTIMVSTVAMCAIMGTSCSGQTQITLEQFKDAIKESKLHIHEKCTVKGKFNDGNGVKKDNLNIELKGQMTEEEGKIYVLNGATTGSAEADEIVCSFANYMNGYYIYEELSKAGPIDPAYANAKCWKNPFGVSELDEKVDEEVPSSPIIRTKFNFNNEFMASNMHSEAKEKNTSEIMYDLTFTYSGNEI